PRRRDPAGRRERADPGRHRRDALEQPVPGLPPGLGPAAAARPRRPPRPHWRRQVLVKGAGFGGGTAPLAQPDHPNDPDDAALGEGQDIARAQGMARLPGLDPVDPHAPALAETGRQAPGLEEAREPQPAIETARLSAPFGRLRPSGQTSSP